MARTPAPTSVLVDGPALRAQRLRTGQTCRQIAEAAGIDASFLARVERGERRIDIDDLVAVVRVLATGIEHRATPVLRSLSTTSTTSTAA